LPYRQSADGKWGPVEVGPVYHDDVREIPFYAAALAAAVVVEVQLIVLSVWAQGH
jgi:hypothetical protein